MRCHTHYVWFETQRRQDIIDIAYEVSEQVAASCTQERFVLVSAMYVTVFPAHHILL